MDPYIHISYKATQFRPLSGSSCTVFVSFLSKYSLTSECFVERLDIRDGIHVVQSATNKLKSKSTKGVIMMFDEKADKK